MFRAVERVRPFWRAEGKALNFLISRNRKYYDYNYILLDWILILGLYLFPLSCDGNRAAKEAVEDRNKEKLAC